jgi:hypothetical protein
MNHQTTETHESREVSETPAFPLQQPTIGEAITDDRLLRTAIETGPAIATRPESALVYAARRLVSGDGLLLSSVVRL